MWAKTTYGNIAAFAALVIISCGEPLAPAATSWHWIATVDPNFDYGRKIAADGNVVYIPCPGMEERPYGRIKKYDNGTLTDAYIPALNGASSVSFTGISVSVKSGWALGSRYYRSGEESHNVPFLVKYADGQWRAENEIEIELEADDYPEAVIAAGVNSCYLIGSLSDERIHKYFYKYDNGVTRRVTAFGGIDAAAYDVPANVVYALAANKGCEDVWISVDAGAHWIHEKNVPRPPITAFSNDHVAAAVAADGSLYVTLETEDPPGLVVYRRTGAPGAGTYELSAYCTANGTIGNGEPADIAIHTHGRILVVGSKTSVYFDGREWHEEELPQKNTFLCITAAPAGFFAVARDGMGSSDNELLYHP